MLDSIILLTRSADSLHSYESSFDHVELSDEFITDNLIVKFANLSVDCIFFLNLSSKFVKFVKLIDSERINDLAITEYILDMTTNFIDRVEI